jgi:hypothetical protein
MEVDTAMNLKNNTFHSSLEEASKCGSVYFIMYTYYYSISTYTFKITLVIWNVKYSLIFSNLLGQFVIFSMTYMSHNFTIFINFYLVVATNSYDIAHHEQPCHIHDEIMRCDTEDPPYPQSVGATYKPLKVNLL